MTHIISDFQADNQRLFSRIDHYFNHLNISKALAKCNFYKESGFSCVTVLKELFSLIFTGKNLYRSLNAAHSELSFKKNTAYRFLNNSRFNWEKLLLILMTCLIQSVERLTGQDRQSVLIVDDSLFSRNRSKKVELFARIFDHTSHKFYKGFRMLTLGWSDGNTFLPVSFNLLSSTNDNKNRLFPTDRRQRDQTYKMPDYKQLHEELAKPHVTLALLWEEYCQDCRQHGQRYYQYTQFRKYYADYAIQDKVTIRIEHKPGELMEVDWAGTQPQYRDPGTGLFVKTPLFVAVLPYSQIIFAEPFEDQKLANWIIAHNHHNKQHKERIVVMSDDMLNLCVEYNEKRKAFMTDDVFFFPADGNKPYNTMRLETLCTTCWRKANFDVLKENLPPLRPYDFRHCFASSIIYRWLDQGRNIEAMLPYLRAYMGHVTFNSTIYYVHLMPERLVRSAGIDLSVFENILPGVDV